VHSINELADLARLQLDKMNQLGQGFPPGGQQPGYAGQPQSGPVPGWAQEPQQGMPGYGQNPQAGPLAGMWPGRARDYGDNSMGGGIEQAIADVALGAAGRFIGRAISRRVQRTVGDRILPATAANRDTVLREQIAVAERYPDLCACMTDRVVFLAGGTSVAPMPDLNKITLQQADELVAQLKTG
jgi:hypothetical protein